MVFDRSLYKIGVTLPRTELIDVVYGYRLRMYHSTLSFVDFWLQRHCIAATFLEAIPNAMNGRVFGGRTPRAPRAITSCAPTFLVGDECHTDQSCAASVAKHGGTGAKPNCCRQKWVRVEDCFGFRMLDSRSRHAGRKLPCAYRSALHRRVT